MFRTCVFKQGKRFHARVPTTENYIEDKSAARRAIKVALEARDLYRSDDLPLVEAVDSNDLFLEWRTRNEYVLRVPVRTPVDLSPEDPFDLPITVPGIRPGIGDRVVIMGSTRNPHHYLPAGNVVEVVGIPGNQPEQWSGLSETHLRLWGRVHRYGGPANMELQWVHPADVRVTLAPLTTNLPWTRGRATQRVPEDLA